MSQLVAVSVGVGLAVSVVASEVFGLAASGLVVPGYLALHVHEPKALATTLAVAVATSAIVRVVSSFVLVYGRRRMAAMLLTGYGLGLLANEWFGQTPGLDEYATIGLVVPGLVAYAIDKHGAAEAIASLATLAVVVRLLLIVAGVELPS